MVFGVVGRGFEEGPTSGEGVLAGGSSRKRLLGPGLVLVG
jgi:hypothetical protein